MTSFAFYAFGISLLTDRQDQPRYLNADGFKIKVFAFSADFIPETLGPGTDSGGRR
jgi:hypothetical protein